MAVSAPCWCCPPAPARPSCSRSVAADQVRAGDRVLILAHRGELLEQAADKLQRSTGLVSAVEKAESTCLDSWYRVVVGSVQTLQRPARLERFPRDYFGTIIIDEAHHSITDGYRRILDYFGSAKVLGVTATPTGAICGTSARCSTAWPMSTS